MIRNSAPAHLKHSPRYALIALVLWALAVGLTPASRAASTLPPPNAPTGLTAARFSSTRLDLTWTDNSADEDGFKIERSLDGLTGWTLVQTTAPNVTSYSNTALARATTYFFRVRATNASGDSANTSSAQATTTVICHVTDVCTGALSGDCCPNCP